MANKGTNEAEQGLNVPQSDEEFAELVLSAVSEGNADEMDRLFSVEIPPDADSQEEEDSEQDSTNTESTGESDASSDAQPAESANKEDSGTTEQTPSPAEERLAKLEKELNDARAAVGRTAALQSRLARLERELKEQKAKQPVEPSPEEKELDERIARLKEIDPDTAAVLEALKQRMAATKPADKGTDGADDALREEYYRVLEAHGDAEAIFKHPAWHLWKDTLTPDQRAWAESSNSQQVIAAIAAFKQYQQQFTQPPQAQAAVAQQAEPPVDTAALARKKKLQTSATSTDKPVKQTPAFDADALFAEAYEKTAKEAGINY